MWTPRIKLADMLTKGRFTEWNRLLCLCNISLFGSQRCSAFSSQNCFEAVAKRYQEGDYDERVVAKSKSVRNLESKGCAGPSTTPSSTVSSRPGIFGSEDHEMRCETRTVRPSSNNQKQSLIEHDRVTNSQERHQDIRSRATPRSPKTRELSQTSENPTACTKHPVRTIESWDAGNGLETKRDCGTIYHTIDSDSEESLEKALIHEFEENQGFMVFSSMPLNIDMTMIRSSNFSRSMFLRFTSS